MVWEQQRLNCQVRLWFRFSFYGSLLSEKVRVWLRSCNVGCTPGEKTLKRDYYVLGHEDGLNSDSYGR